ncbi:bifunctional diaminohydroxyphosphoribosylaminopyrimidine deaminase/5-amino-6-(5-phosphoribosylamino)uracil reductase RibD [Sulfurimonas lithotrophica]|uniref:Riboflavin biosynthesis protein RibD n=1 Tax=Sulfurimonas lithotrophica TaxID=2590022 RepID=A0A5P8P1J7_9BACT|nr:bifunctional diaminohydroxyphosphoribosylaminopyrimidine deaminase/5-amino-6-(5-phosphoribosylamino)uracil reductase RibD [Sulfurimonas lithotrophica]QFR49536.1 bifunctional diaminohydroxyphosphoribosylaminopyrimidine deaminase/5-amino-6-(5-phosphoribosylamino)uracil reductase RibD [Sulfurimonas lithotrophica]
MVANSEFFMNLALKEAWKYQGLTYPNPAVGCCVVSESGAILSVEAHKKAGLPHAEVEALKSAYFKLTNDEFILKLTNSADIHKYLIQNHNGIFKNCSVYTTLEPCSHIGKTPSCADLLSLLSIKKVYVGALDTNPEAACGNKKLLDADIEIQNGVLEAKCKELLYPFERWSKDKFVFFKWAQRLNGTYDGGIITSKESRKNVHDMRDKCDLLVIGGESVRIDRPTLDARLVDGKAPDILIYSRKSEFDKTIPLFKVEGRKVIISDNLDIIQKYKNIMIEGGANMFEATRDIVDRYLCYIAPKVGGSKVFNTNIEEFEILNILQDDKDIIMWLSSRQLIDEHNLG